MSVPMTKLASSPAKDHWGPPYLLYLGNAKDRLSIKTARGLAFGDRNGVLRNMRGRTARRNSIYP